jgi:hypothetical protein
LLGTLIDEFDWLVIDLSGVFNTLPEPGAPCSDSTWVFRCSTHASVMVSLSRGMATPEVEYFTPS